MTKNVYSWDRDSNGGYDFVCATFRAYVWRDKSDYGDIQWYGDIHYFDGRNMGYEHIQVDYLNDIRRALVSKASE
jgi:hypothetical protein